MDAYTKRTGRDARQAFAVGDADTVMNHLAEFVDNGVAKFILRPLGADEAAVMDQTKQLIEKVLPQIETRWPKKAKVPSS